VNLRSIYIFWRVSLDFKIPKFIAIISSTIGIDEIDGYYIPKDYKLEKAVLKDLLSPFQLG